MRALLVAVSCLVMGCGAAPAASGPDYELIEGNEAAANDGVQGTDDGPTAHRADTQAATEDRPPPATAEAAPEREGTYVLVDGQEAAITRTKLVAIDDKRNVVTLTIEGPGVPVASEIRILLQKTTAGCVVAGTTSQGVLYFPGATSSQYRSKNGAACGLDVTAYASRKGEVTTGRFEGLLDGLGDQAGMTHRVALGFSVVRDSDPPPPPPCVKTGSSPQGGSCCSGKAAYQGSMLVCL